MTTMHIKGRLIAGIRAAAVRDALRSTRNCEVFTYTLFVQECKVSERKAREIVKALRADNFLEIAERPGWARHQRVRWYRATTEGFKLSNATGLQRMGRSKAERMLADFLKRVQEVNAHPEYIYSVCTVIVSGSYARGESELGDLDIVYELKPRFKGSEQSKAEDNCIEAARTRGRSFPNYVAELYWPQHEVELHLKARTRGLSLHTLDDFFRMKKDTGFAYQVLVGDAAAIAAKLEATVSQSGA
jgi:predicted nucleotidyltransferase